MANIFSSLFSRRSNTEPVLVPDSASGVERRDFDLKSSEAQKIFVWGRQPDSPDLVVNDFSIISSTPFYGAMRYVSEGIAMLDRKVKKRDGLRFYDDHDHPISYLLKRRPNPYYTWFDMFAAWICNAMLGNGYIRIHWDSWTGRPESFEHLPSRYVYPEFDTKGFLWYRVEGEISGKSVSLLLPHTDVLHLKGLSLDSFVGAKTSAIHYAAHGSALAADNYTQSIFGKGAFPSIAVKTKETLDSTEAALIEDNLMSRIGGSKNAGRPLVLDGDKDVQYLQWSPLDVALEAVKHMSIEQVSQITKVPRDLLALDTSGTYGAAVQRRSDFYVHCLQPWSQKIEEEITTKLFSSLEVSLGTYTYEFDASLYLSMSPKDQTEMFEVAIKSSQLTPNEARQERGLDPLPGGDTLYGDINTLPLEQLVEVAFAKYLSSVGEGNRQQNEDASALSDNEADNTKEQTDNEQETQSAQ